MRRNPGEWLRQLLLEKMLDIAVPVTAALGWLGGAGVALGSVGGIHGFAEPIAWLVLAPGLVFLAFAAYRAQLGWGLHAMRTGARAEATVGQALEYALTRPRCAVAHNVRDMPGVGDIDHLVAVDGHLWVIETKYTRVPKARFPEVLRRIAANVAAVRAWAPHAPVTGCLVFADPEQNKRPRPTFTHGTETIRAFPEPAALVRVLQDHRHPAPGADRLARRVWGLAGPEPQGSGRTTA